MDHKPIQALPTASRTSLEAVREVLSSKPEMRLAVAFGSIARNQQRPDSDLDILLDIGPDDDATRRAIETALTRAVHRELRVLYVSEAPPLLRFQVTRDGILIAERPVGEWVRFKAQAMIDWWDWAPVARRIYGAAFDRLCEETALGRR